MSLPVSTTVSLSPGVPEALARLPAAAGVGQVLGEGGRSLVLAPAAHLRRWAASQLGLGPRPKAGRRPRTDLSAVATAIVFVQTSGSFEQRLVYERLMEPLLPLAKRRDLKPPAALHLDPTERFARLRVVDLVEPPAGLYGPFRDRRAAEKARDAVQRRFALRPCDHRFEPAEDLPLGLACLYAQVRSCAAPCLRRTSEGDYRGLAERVAAWLADPLRPDSPAELPPAVSAVDRGRALVVDRVGEAAILYPVVSGRVCEAAARRVAADGVDAALAGLDWRAPDRASDWPWLLAWLRAPRARGAFVPVVGDAESVAACVRTAMAAPSGRRRGDKVGATRRTP